MNRCSKSFGSFILALWIAFVSGAASAQTKVWQPPPGHTQVPIWPKELPDAQPVLVPESVQTDPENPVGGKPMF
jgi:hypothetical protein